MTGEPLTNLHATGLVVGDLGIVILGEAGAGKTSLALRLIAAAQLAGRHAALVADDQILVRAQAGRLVAFAPASIAGLVEVRGSTPQKVDFLPAAVIDVAVRLVAEASVPRYAEQGTTAVAGCALLALDVALRPSDAQVLATLSLLGLPPFR